VQRYHVGLRIDDRVDEVRELLKGEAHLIAKMITVVDLFDADDEVTQAAFANFAGHAYSAHQAAAGPSRIVQAPAAHAECELQCEFAGTAGDGNPVAISE
jgi:hypothetical protein